MPPTVGRGRQRAFRLALPLFMEGWKKEKLGRADTQSLDLKSVQRSNCLKRTPGYESPTFPPARMHTDFLEVRVLQDPPVDEHGNSNKRFTFFFAHRISEAIVVVSSAPRVSQCVVGLRQHKTTRAGPYQRVCQLYDTYVHTPSRDTHERCRQVSDPK